MCSHGPEKRVASVVVGFPVVRDLPYERLSINADRQEYFDVLSSRNLGQLNRLVAGRIRVAIHRRSTTHSKQRKAPKSWLTTYSEATFEVINRENHLDFLLLS